LLEIAYMIIKFVLVKTKDSIGGQVRSPFLRLGVFSLLSLLFLAFSLWAVWREGPVGFWAEHTRNLWGQQIWFDLLLAAGTAWAALLPQARAAGMRPGFWLLAVVCSGSIGLLAMLARLLYLRERSARG
ncbi:MAG: hypothetical protein J0M00_20545, partial [Burkholderiales bacterium]|nr:hypothetical protein [Burkholderiales bacterium]